MLLHDGACFVADCRLYATLDAAAAGGRRAGAGGARGDDRGAIWRFFQGRRRPLRSFTGLDAFGYRDRATPSTPVMAGTPKQVRTGYRKPAAETVGDQGIGKPAKGEEQCNAS